MTVTYPDAFLEVRFEAVNPSPATLGLCAGFDGGIWRSARFADHLFQWVPFAALSQEHQLAFGASNFVEMLRIACAHVYHTKRTTTRGEIGELMLHIACVRHFNAIPVVCKLILKTTSNDTVKGFDGVHLLPLHSGFELWLGESKFYISPEDAIREAVKSISDHILPKFLNTEKAMLIGHVAEGIPHRSEVLKLFKSQTSGDDLLKRSVFPVLIAYESTSVAAHTSVVDMHIDQLRGEVENLRAYFGGKATGIPLRFQLLFVPLGKKKDLVESFDALMGPFL